MFAVSYAPFIPILFADDGVTGALPQLPLTAPRNLRWAPVTNGVRYDWDAPLYWGPGPASPNRYQVDWRFATAEGGTVFHSSAPTSAAQHINQPSAFVRDPASPSFTWSRFRVRALDSDGNYSGWVETPALQFRNLGPQGRFSRRFSQRFQ